MGKRALIVDDSATIRSMVKTILMGEGFEVITAQDGEKAIKTLGDETVDIIITDINMPNMDGIELIKALKATANSKYTPMLVITTESGDTLKAKGREAGASGWMTKPFSPDTLVKAVNKLTIS